MWGEEPVSLGLRRGVSSRESADFHLSCLGPGWNIEKMSEYMPLSDFDAIYL